MQLSKSAKYAIDFLMRAVARHLPAWDKFEVLATYGTKGDYQPALPANIALLPNGLALDFFHAVKLDEFNVYAVNKMDVTWDGSIFKNLRVFLPSLVRTAFIHRLQDSFLLRQWLGDHVQLPDGESAIAVVHDEWSVGNYYHWLVDSLPRLLVLRQLYPNHLLLLPAFLPPKKEPDYIRLSAAALGFNKYFFLNTRQILQAERIILPELTSKSLFQNPAMVTQVRAELLNGLGLRNAVPSKRIYASRATQLVRKVLNEAEVQTLLQAYNFEVVLFEELSFVEQMHLMQQTALFLGVHGAGMTNLMFLQPEAKVIELLNQNHGDLCYFRLASCCSLPYICVPCESADQTLLNQADIQVDIEMLRTYLEFSLN